MAFPIAGWPDSAKRTFWTGCWSAACSFRLRRPQQRETPLAGPGRLFVRTFRSVCRPPSLALLCANRAELTPLEPARFCDELNHPQRQADLVSVFYECQLPSRTVGV